MNERMNEYLNAVRSTNIPSSRMIFIIFLRYCLIRLHLLRLMNFFITLNLYWST